MKKMKKIITVLVLTLSALFSFAQTADKMKKHSGETLDVKVIKVNEETISSSTTRLLALKE